MPLVNPLKEFFSKARPASNLGNFLAQRATAALPSASAAPSSQAATRVRARILRNLVIVLAGTIVLIASLVYALWVQSVTVSQQLRAVEQALFAVQRLALAAAQVMEAPAQSYTAIAQSADTLSTVSQTLRRGDDRLHTAPLDNVTLLDFDSMFRLAQRAVGASGALAAQQDAMVRMDAALRSMDRSTGDMLELTQTLTALMLQQSAPLTFEVAAVGQMSMLTQRIAKTAQALWRAEPVSAEFLLLLRKDLSAFQATSQALWDGNPQMRINAIQAPVLREQLAELTVLYNSVVTQATTVLDQQSALTTTRDARQVILKDAGPLQSSLEALHASLRTQMAAGPAGQRVLALLGVVAFLAAGAIGYLLWRQAAQREAQRVQTQSELAQCQQDAAGAQSTHEGAMRGVMNALHRIAQGDWTLEASASADLCGAQADAVNHTVEALRAMASSVHEAVHRVAEIGLALEAASTQLLAAFDEQLQEMRETGPAVLQMATRINAVASLAQDSAPPAMPRIPGAQPESYVLPRVTLGVLTADARARPSTDSLRQIEACSQDIAAIVQRLADTAEMTRFLALNAAIVATSSGGSGQGFSVVADELLGLCERSLPATQQLAALAQTITSQAGQAIAVFESGDAAGLVPSAAGLAAARTPATEGASPPSESLHAQIAQATAREALVANTVADKLQHLASLTEQANDNVQRTAQQVHALLHMCDVLRQSVLRFKVS